MISAKPFTITTWRHIFNVINVFRRLTPRFAELTQHLSKHLTTNQPLCPTDNDFDEIMKLEKFLPTLRLRMPSKLSEIILVTDFSPIVIAGDAKDHSHPVTCLSEKLPPNSPISSTHGEALAGLKYTLWSHQTFGPVHIMLLTDSEAALSWMTMEPPFLSLSLNPFTSRYTATAYQIITPRS
eukprot:GHVP01055596.1.p1 GENE.GHVP01055596.1~~GHVP01055596.1.p1  ORF type:complete len:182 (-),score=6.25 GHVP01055596.1:83-628(-)